MRQQRGNIPLIFLLAVLGVTLVGGGFFLGQKRQPAEKTIMPQTVLPTPTATPLLPSPTDTVQLTPTSTPVQAVKTVVVFEAEGAISTEDKSRLQQKVVAPYLDYQRDLNGEGYVISLTISPNIGANKTNYPYQAKAIFKNGGYEGFVVTKDGGGIDWWLPECMGPCPFSANFKAKYPEIIAKFP